MHQNSIDGSHYFYKQVFSYPYTLIRILLTLVFYSSFSFAYNQAFLDIGPDDIEEQIDTLASHIIQFSYWMHARADLLDAKRWSLISMAKEQIGMYRSSRYMF